MQEQLISFETAKLAKYKGFRKTSGWIGFVDKFYHPRTGTLLSMGRTGKTPFHTLIYAPTQSLLQRWLREVHKIHLVCWWYDKNDKFYTELGRKGDNIIRVQTGDTTKLFNTYEEALEAGLLAALKLIK